MNSPASMALPRRPRPAKVPEASMAFTLIELLVVMAIIGILLVAALPAITGLTGATTLSTATRQVSNTLALARTEAIARNTITRVAIAREWPEDPDLAYRKISIWAWDRDTSDYVIISDWETLPDGVAFETESPAYIEDAEYVTSDITNARVDFCLDGARQAPAFEAAMAGGQVVVMEYLEFLPNGAARIPEGTERKIALLLTEGFREGGAAGTIVYTNQLEGQPRNWAQLNVSNLTGRVKIYRP